MTGCETGVLRMSGLSVLPLRGALGRALLRAALSRALPAGVQQLYGRVGRPGRSAAARACRGKYDFFYLPIDYKNKCNLGYCFMNFLGAELTAACYEEFHHKRWELFNSKKARARAPGGRAPGLCPGQRGRLGAARGARAGSAFAGARLCVGAAMHAL